MSGNAPATESTPTEAPTAPPPAPPVLGPGAELVAVTQGHDVPARLADQLALAEAIYRSNMVPTACRSVAGMMAAMYAAKALNVPLWTAMQSMHNIDGKVGWEATFIRALVIRAGHRIRVTERTAERAVVRIIRHDDPEPFFGEFSRQDAIDAGLLSPTPRTGEVKDNWRKYGKAMLVARATTIAVREACPEVLFGNGYTPEELGADTDEDGTPIITVPAQQGQPIPTVHRVTADPADVAAVKAQWRTDIAEAADLAAVDALYARARGQRLLEAPLTDEGLTVEAALAERAHELRAAAADDAAEVHDADVVADDTPPAAEPAAAPAAEPAPDDDPPPQPDSPEACRDTAARRGVLKHLAQGGDVEALVQAEYGLPLAQVATRRLLDLAKTLGRTR